MCKLINFVIEVVSGEVVMGESVDVDVVIVVVKVIFLFWLVSFVEDCIVLFECIIGCYKKCYVDIVQVIMLEMGVFVLLS